MYKQYLAEEIKGKRITLRKHSLKLAEQMFSYVDSDRERLRKFLPWVDFTKTVSDECEYIKKTHEDWQECKLFDYSIFENIENCYLGNVGIHTISWANECCEIGYWILEKYEGKGYISEAVNLLESECFAKGFNRIEIRCSSLNQRSANVPVRCGYQLDGILRQNRFEHGKFHDTLVFAKLRSPSEKI